MHKLATVLVLLCTLFVTNACAQDDQSVGDEAIPEIEFGEVSISINGRTINLEYAHTFDQRARGLMYREKMCTDCGMLFEFEYSRVAGFWMKNTLIPLDIAYIDRAGVIANIEPMYPLVLESVPSAGAVMFAWEMNQGWFAANNIKAGDKIQILKRRKVR